jgi:hypothetical protein
VLKKDNKGAIMVDLNGKKVSLLFHDDSEDDESIEEEPIDEKDGDTIDDDDSGDEDLHIHQSRPKTPGMGGSGYDEDDDEEEEHIIKKEKHKKHKEKSKIITKLEDHYPHLVKGIHLRLHLEEHVEAYIIRLLALYEQKTITEAETIAKIKLLCHFKE